MKHRQWGLPFRPGLSHPYGGARVETVGYKPTALAVERRTPTGVRGLKRVIAKDAVIEAWSHPYGGARVETPGYRYVC